MTETALNERIVELQENEDVYKRQGLRNTSGRAIHHTPGRPENSIGRLAMTRGG